MPFIILVDFLIVIFGLLFLITQIILPTSRGTKIFPMFTSKQSKLEAELAAANQTKHEQGIQKKIDQVKNEISKK